MNEAVESVLTRTVREESPGLFDEHMEAQVVRMLEEAVELEPQTEGYAQQLDRARQAAGG